MKNSILPSKRFILIFCLVAFFIIAGIFFTKHRKSGETFAKKTQSLQSVETAVVSDIVDRDTDGDGIRDWEESLWGTDPKKTDTDEDGVSDSVYIETKKLALRKDNPDANTDDIALNETDELAKDLFATIISLKQSGNLNATSISQIADKLAKSVGQNKNLPDIYSETDLKILPKNTRVEIVSYNKAVQELTDTYGETEMGMEISVLGELVDTGFGADQLSTIAEDYQNFAKEFMAIPVPAGNADVHLLMANAFQKTGVSIKNMALVIENPLIGLIGIGQYHIYNTDIEFALDDMATYLERNGILQL